MSESTQVFEFVTLFPELIEGFVGSGLMGKAIESGRVAVHATNPREFTHDRHRTVDDAPFGGGAGMVMRPEPVAAAVESIETQRGRSLRVLVTPSAPRFDQVAARELATCDHITFLCGRYEGIDDRIREQMVDRCYSLGDFVLNGGEVAALAIFEAVARLRAGVLGNPESVETESFAEGNASSDHALLEHPHYTRPASWQGHSVPEVLRSGDHASVARWRRHAATQRTHELRPELRPARNELREVLDVPRVLAVLLPKDFDLAALKDSTGPGAGIDLVWVGGRGRAPEGVQRVRELRELRQKLRRESHASEAGRSEEAEREPARVWTVEVSPEPGAPADALSAQALADVRLQEESAQSTRSGMIFLIRWPGSRAQPAIDARIRLERPRSSSQAQDEQIPDKALAISTPLIDISQPARPQMATVAAALKRCLEF